MYQSRDVVGIMKGMGAVLPLSIPLAHMVVHFDHGGDGTLLALWTMSTALPLLGFFLGTRYNGRKLTIAAIAGCAISSIAFGIVAYQASQPIVIPPYP